MIGINAMKKLLLGGMFFLLSSTSFSYAADIPVNTGNYNGSRTKSLLLNPSGGITASGLGSLLTYTIGWNITNLGNGVFRYLYNFGTLSSLTSANADVFLELGGNTVLSNLSHIKVNSFENPSPTMVTISNYTNEGVKGILFDANTLTISNISFEVAAAPIWGSFEHGSILGLLGNVQNTNYGIAATSATTGNYIAIAGGVPVPEPGTWLILGSSLLLVAYVMHRRKLVKTS